MSECRSVYIVECGFGFRSTVGAAEGTLLMFFAIEEKSSGDDIVERPAESKIDARKFGLWFGRIVDEIIFGGIFWLAGTSMFIFDELADLRIVFFVAPFEMGIFAGNSMRIFDELPDALRIVAREPVETASFADDADLRRGALEEPANVCLPWSILRQRSSKVRSRQ